MNALVRYQVEGRTSAEISGSVEQGIRAGRLRPGDRLPPVRDLAGELGVSPGTVAAAYRALRMRGMTVGEGRRGTRVADRPAVAAHWPAGQARHRGTAALPPGVHDLSNGSPDESLLPDLGPHLRRLASAAATAADRRYGAPTQVAELTELARRQFRDDDVPDDTVTVVGGALDGIERVLQAHLHPGDTVIVEDPGYPPVLDLAGALGLMTLAVRVDDEGIDADDFGAALRSGADAVVLTPRAHNPTGAMLSETRARRLRAVLGDHPGVLVIEDDHASQVAGASYLTLADPGRRRWAVVRSVSKAMGPDLRVALLAGDEATVALVEGRRQLGPGWVSHLLQRLVVALWSDPAVADQLAGASVAYQERRVALIEALGGHGLAAHGSSGLNVWVPVPDEASVVTGMLASGWAVTAGARFRRRTPPAVRISVGALPPGGAASVAAAVAASISSASGGRLG